jgi:hypothetical protein
MPIAKDKMIVCYVSVGELSTGEGVDSFSRRVGDGGAKTMTKRNAGLFIGRTRLLLYVWATRWSWWELVSNHSEGNFVGDSVDWDQHIDLLHLLIEVEIDKTSYRLVR